jgi:hypothetical protein
MSYLYIRKQDPTAGTKGIMCGGVFLPTEDYDAGAATPAEQIPTSGMVFYLPCDSSDYTTAQTGQSLTKTGTVTAKTVDGIPCLEIKSGSYLSGTLDGFSGDVSMAMSFWFKRLNSNSSAYITAGRGNYSLSGGDEIWASVESDHIETACGSSGSDARRAGIYNATIGTGWHHGYFSYDATSKKFKTVLDGDTENAAYSAERSYNFSSGLKLGINTLMRYTGVQGNADYSRIRIFNRALTDAEIKLLAREFVFNSAPSDGKKGILIPSGEALAAPPANGLIFNASYAEDMTDSDGESPVDGTGYTIVEDAAGFKCLNVEKSNMQDSMYYDGTQEKMQFGTGNFAVGFYLKSVKPWSDYNGIVLANVLADSGFTGFVFYKNRDSGKKSMVVRFGTGTDIYSESDVDTNWHYWLFMRDGDTVKIYKDGKVDATKAYSGSVNANVDLYIGGYYSNWASFTSAYFRLSNVRIYNRALTDAEIQSLAFEHNPTKSLFIPLQTAYGTPQAGQKGIIVRSSQVVGHALYSKSAEAMPTEGLVFHASLSEESSTAETGQALTKNGTITYETLVGIPCITKGTTSAYLSAPLSVEGVFTLSFWIKTTYTGEYIGMAYVGGLCIFDASSNSSFQFSAKKNSSERINFQGISKPLKWRDGAWHHIAMSITSTESKLYCDGTLISTASGVNISTSSHAYIGWDNDGDNAAASYAQFRIFNRALSDAEIKTLAGEYKQDEIKKMFIAVKGTEIADIPQDGLIFHAPFNGNTTPNVGAMVLVGNEGDIAYNTQDGITYAVLPGTFGWRIYAQGTTDLTVGNEYSYICYYRDDSDHSKPRRFLMNMNLGPRYQNTYVPNSVNKLNVCDRTIDSSSGKWHFICIRSNGSVASIKGFLDTSTWTSGAPGNPSSRTDSFLAAPSDWATSSIGEYWHGGIFDFAVYNRILTDAEVESLYQRIFWLQA